MNLFKIATERNSLREAWSRIRSNGQNSQLRDTKEAVEAFSQRAERNIWRISTKRLDELPFRLPKPKRFRNTKDLVIISTDGSLRSISAGIRSDRGPGGWAAVFHGRDKRISGHSVKTTNIRMELTAVVESLRETPAGCRVEIRTDSRYVHDIVNERNMIRKNHDLWKEFQLYASERHVRVTWVRGHSGDSYNEQADRLANEEAGVARRLALGQTDAGPIENDPVKAQAAQSLSKDAA